MKLKELAKELELKPVELIKELEADIAPGCDALTELSDDQVAAARLHFQQPQAEESAIAADSLTEDIDRQLAADVVGARRQEIARNQADYLINVYETQGLLPAGADGQIDQRRAALVSAASAKKHQPQWGGEVMTLAAQVTVVDGQVLLPDMPLPQIELMPAPSDLLPESQQKSAVAPALPSASVSNS